MIGNFVTLKIKKCYIFYMKNNQKIGSKVVVTGGAGFIGSHLVDALVKKGYFVEVIDNLSSGKQKENLNRKANYHEKNICDLEAIKPIIKGAKYVFHLAALPRVPYSIEHPIETSEVNVMGMLNVLVASKEGGVERLIYSASSSAYGDQPVMPKTSSKKELVRPTDSGRFRPLKEDMKAGPKSPYGLQKYIGELYCKVWSEVYGLPTVSLRYFNVYGPRLNPDGAYALVIGKFLKQRKEGKPLTIMGDGTQTRDFTHVFDVVRANILASESPKVGKGEVINIGAGKNYSVNDVAKMIGGEVSHGPARMEPHDTLADNSLAKNLLGWVPEISLEEGIVELKKEFGIV